MITSGHGEARQIPGHTPTTRGAGWCAAGCGWMRGKARDRVRVGVGTGGVGQGRRSGRESHHFIPMAYVVPRMCP